MRTEGMPLGRAWRARKLVPRKLVFLGDVSGSMEPYARAMVMFLQAGGREGAAATSRRSRSAPGSRASRRSCGTRPGRRRCERASAAMPDWGGGTRIGESLRAYNEQLRPARADPRRGRRDRLRRLGAGRPRAARRSSSGAIARQAATLVWVNPLKGHQGFEPLAGGMRVALRHVDVFLAGPQPGGARGAGRGASAYPSGRAGADCGLRAASRRRPRPTASTTPCSMCRRWPAACPARAWWGAIRMAGTGRRSRSGRARCGWATTGRSRSSNATTPPVRPRCAPRAASSAGWDRRRPRSRCGWIRLAEAVA